MKKVLITGGNGFLGRHLAKMLQGEYEVMIASRNLEKNREVAAYAGCDFYVMDICRIESIRDTFRRFEPDIVIHAAANKYMDFGEEHPLEVVDINVVGSQNLVRVSEEYRVGFVLGISTDKAAPPVRNTYGLTKAMMEKVMCLGNSARTRFSCVRFGNLAWSYGSVFPKWKKMHDDTGRIMVRGHDLRKFFMSVGMAVNCVGIILRNQDELQGKIISPYLKSVQMQNVVDVWCSIYGDDFRIEDERLGERPDEFLVGSSEVAYTQLITLENCLFFITDPRNKVISPVSSYYSTFNAQRFTNEDIHELIRLYVP